MKNNKSLASIVTVLLVIVALMEIGHLFFVNKQIQELSNLTLEDTYGSIYEYQNRMNGMEVYAFLSNMIELASIITFLCWFYSLYANLTKAGIKSVKYSNVYAVLMWIIPILNLFKSFELTKEVVDKSQVKIKELVPGYTVKSLNGLINSCQWVMIIHFILGITFFVWGVSKDSLGDGIIELKVGLGFSVVMMVEMLLLASMVYKVDRIEEKLYKAVVIDN
jgi:hypothetical protein